MFRLRDFDRDKTVVADIGVLETWSAFGPDLAHEVPALLARPTHLEELGHVSTTAPARRRDAGDTKVDADLGAGLAISAFSQGEGPGVVRIAGQDHRIVGALLEDVQDLLTLAVVSIPSIRIPANSRNICSLRKYPALNRQKVPQAVS